jgi:hypothetical protein
MAAKVVITPITLFAVDFISYKVVFQYKTNTHYK